MIKTFICTGDLNRGEAFHVTDSEDIDAMVNDPVAFFSGLVLMGYRLIQIVPTLYTISEGKMSLAESVWIMELTKSA